MTSRKLFPLPEEIILKRILLLRGEKVILDIHLAEFYRVETRTLKQAVKRNLERFPDDFMFELNAEEIDLPVSQSVIPSKSHLGEATQFAFTDSRLTTANASHRFSSLEAFHLRCPHPCISPLKLYH